jgi:hypothetical protein
MNIPGVYFVSGAKFPKTDQPVSPHHRLHLLSNINDSTNLSKEDIVRFLWNLESFIAKQPQKTTIDDCLFQISILCSTCSSTKKCFIIYAFPDHFDLFLIRFCQHQPWVISKYSSHKKKYQSPFKMPTNNFSFRHPFRVFGKFLLDNYGDHLGEDEKEFFYSHCFSVGAQYLQRLQSKNGDSLYNLIAHTPGKFVLYCRTPVENPLLLY